MLGKFFKKSKVAEAVQENKPAGEILTEADYIAQNGEDAAERVRKEYSFYQDSFHSAMKIILVMGVSFAFYVMTDVYKAVTHKDSIETFFVTNQNNQIIPLTPVNQAFAESDVTNWAAEAIMDIYTLSPLDFRKRVTVDFQKYFTPDGLKNYRQAIAPRLNQITSSTQSMTATPSGSPVIINKGVLDNRYYWQVMLPIQVTYVSKDERITELRRVVMNIVRADQSRYPSGLAFTSIDESEPINSSNLR